MTKSCNTAFWNIKAKLKRISYSALTSIFFKTRCFKCLNLNDFNSFLGLVDQRFGQNTREVCSRISSITDSTLKSFSTNFSLSEAVNNNVGLGQLHEILDNGENVFGEDDSLPVLNELSAGTILS